MLRASHAGSLLAIIAVILVIAAVRLGYPVLMPIVVATFVIATAWPIRNWFDARLPSALSYVCTIIALLLLLGGFVAIIGVAFSRVVQTFFAQQDQLREVFDSYARIAGNLGLPTPFSGAGEGGSDFDRITTLVQMLISEVYKAVSYFGIVAVIVILGFPEVPAVARRVRHEFGLDSGDQPSWVTETAADIAHGFRSYLAMTALASLITGIASGLWAYSVGLDLAFVWGLINFLLNFVPLIGNVIGVILPTLYAAIQFDGWTMPLVVFGGFLVIHFLISNFVYPMLQSRGLKMPPVTVIVALLFWGWTWGLVGALLAVPLTAAAIIVLGKFERTRPVAAILGSTDPTKDADG